MNGIPFDLYSEGGQPGLFLPLGSDTYNDPLPLSLILTLVTRRPARLTEQTGRIVMNGSIPVAAWFPNLNRVKASIVLVTFNNLVFTRMCLASLLANTDAPDYEVIVVDNASGDGTVDYLRAVAVANPHVSLILNETNRGFAPANNQALAKAKGDVLILLNNDTILAPDWLNGLIHHLQDPSVGLVGPVTNRIGNEAEMETTYTTYADFLEFVRRNWQEHHGQHFDIPVPCMFCLAMRRDAFNRIGPLDERFKFGLFEDDDYALRAREAGYRVVCVEDIFVHHFGQGSFGELVPTGEYGRLFEANKQSFEEKWGRPWQPHCRRRNLAYDELKQRICRLVCEATPPTATVLVVSKGDEQLLRAIEFDGRRAWHFPQSADGNYAGYYPEDSVEAIEHLEYLRVKGATHVFFPKPAMWWMRHYTQFRHHLESRYASIAQEEACVIFDLATAPDRV